MSNTTTAAPPAETGKTPANAAPSNNPIDRFEAARERCVRLFDSEDRFIEEATHLLAIVNNTPSLLECTPASINGVLINIASTGLSLNPVMKLAYVIPRSVKVKTPGPADKWEKRATVEPSYMGLMKLAFAMVGSRISEMRARILRTNDELTNALSTIQNMATHDSLTALPNRASLADTLAHAITRAERSRETVSVFCGP